MKIDNSLLECSFNNWYPKFKKDSIQATIVPLTEEVLKYLEHDAFILPIEASVSNTGCKAEWCDGSVVSEDQSDDEIDNQPTFPSFSSKIQEAIDDYSAIFIKCNWSTPLDASWVTATKTLKCTTLEDVYLLLKSSDRIAKDLIALKNFENVENTLKPSIALKVWKEIDPCTEFRCFVKNKNLIGISQRDTSHYYKYIENERYDIQSDIRSLFKEKIENQFPLSDYTFDVIRYKKDRVKIIDFGVLNELAIKDTLFTLEEIQNETVNSPEFRFIAEDMGIQPKSIKNICVPQEIHEFFNSTSGMTVVDAIQKEIEEQNKEKNGTYDAKQDI